MASATTSNYLQQAVLNNILRAEPWTAPTTIYVALFTNGAPSLNGTGGTEVAENAQTNYTRVAIPAGPTSWSTASGVNQEYSNLIEIVYNVPGSQAWGTITSCGLYDAQTGGNLLWVGTIGTAKPVSPGDGAPRILAGQLKISRATC